MVAGIWLGAVAGGHGSWWGILMLAGGVQLLVGHGIWWGAVAGRTW